MKGRFEDSHIMCTWGPQNPCPHCDHKATRKWTLKEHMLAVHEGIEHLCPQCDHHATCKEALKKHIQTKHERL